VHPCALQARDASCQALPVNLKRRTTTRLGRSCAQSKALFPRWNRVRVAPSLHRRRISRRDASRSPRFALGGRRARALGGAGHGCGGKREAKREAPETPEAPEAPEATGCAPVRCCSRLYTRLYSPVLSTALPHSSIAIQLRSVRCGTPLTALRRATYHNPNPVSPRCGCATAAAVPAKHILFDSHRHCAHRARACRVSDRSACSF
jgi:hypothetical protein